MDATRKLKVLVAAGGTGGHLFPALAVVEELQTLLNGRLIPIFVGNGEKIESRVVPELGYQFHKIPVKGFSGMFQLSTLTLPIKIFNSILKCRSLIRKHKIDVCICAGAYISYPAGIAATQEHIPLILMESNVFPGKTNRLLSQKATAIFTAFDESERYFPQPIKRKIRCLGNPIRRQLINLPNQQEARIKFNLDPNKKTILVFGGSLGARSINQAIEKILPNFTNSDIQFLWQTGSNYIPPQELPANVTVLPFINDMASAYASADLVISRSGATTVTELCVVGKPSILIPLPTAANNEQELNAAVLEEKKAAVMLPDEHLNDELEAVIHNIISDNKLLSWMGKIAKSVAKPDAAKKSAEEVLKIVWEE